MRLSWQAHDKTTALDKSPKPSYREKEISEKRNGMRAEAQEGKVNGKQSGPKEDRILKRKAKGVGTEAKAREEGMPKTGHKEKERKWLEPREKKGREWKK